MANILPSPPLFGLTSGRLIVATGAASVGNSSLAISGTTLDVSTGNTLSLGTSVTGLQLLGSATIYPGTTGTGALGSAAHIWSNSYIQNLYTTGIDQYGAATLNIGVTTATNIQLGGGTTNTVSVLASNLVLGLAGSVVYLGGNSGASGAGSTATWNRTRIYANAATNLAQLQNSAGLDFVARYWAGGVGPSSDTVYSIYAIADSTAPTSHLAFQFNSGEIFQFTSTGAFGLVAGGSISNFTAGATNTTGLTITSNVANGASSIGLKINTVAAIPAGKLVSIQSAGVEAAYFAYDSVNSNASFVIQATTFSTNSGGNGFNINSGNAVLNLYANGQGVQIVGFTAPPSFNPIGDNAVSLGNSTSGWKSAYLGAGSSILMSAQSATNTTSLTINPNVADGATSIGLVIDNGTVLTSGGAKLLEMRIGGGALGSYRYYPGVGTIFGWQAAGDTMYIDTNKNGFTIQSGVTYFYANNGTAYVQFSAGNFNPFADLGTNLGSAAKRWSGVVSSDFTSQGDTAAPATIHNSGFLHLVGTYYTTVSTNYDIKLQTIMINSTPTARLSFNINGNDRLNVVDVGGGLGAVYFGPYTSNDYIYGGNNTVVVRAAGITMAQFSSTNAQIQSPGGSGTISVNDSAGAGMAYASNNILIDSTNTTINMGGNGSLQIFGNAGVSPVVKVRAVSSNTHALTIFQDSNSHTRFGVDAMGLPSLGSYHWLQQTFGSAPSTPVTTGLIGGTGFAIQVSGGLGAHGGSTVSYDTTSAIGAGLLIDASATANNYSVVYNNYYGAFAANTSTVAVFEWSALMTSQTNNVNVHMSIANSAQMAHPNGFGFWWGGSGNWQWYTDNGVTRTISACSVAVAPTANRFQRFRIEFYGSTSPLGAVTAKLYIDGTLVQTITGTNVVTPAASGFEAGVQAIASAGTPFLVIAEYNEWWSLVTTPFSP